MIRIAATGDVRIGADSAGSLRPHLERLPDGVATSDGIVLNVEDGEAYVPQLFASLGVPITHVSISKPSLDDVFLSYTGRTIRDSESGPAMPAFFAAMARR